MTTRTTRAPRLLRNRAVGLGAALVLGLTACGGGDPAPSQQDSASATTSSAPGESTSGAPSSSQEATTSAPDGSDIVTSPPARSWKDALAAAQRGLASGKPTKIELERDDAGKLHYKVELIDSQTKYAAQYDANTLAKLTEKRDSLGKDAATEQKKTFDPSALVPVQKAADAAREKQPGTITEWKVEGKGDGRTLYEFDIRPAGASQDREIKVDATSGQVVAR